MRLWSLHILCEYQSTPNKYSDRTLEELVVLVQRIMWRPPKKGE